MPGIQKPSIFDVIRSTAKNAVTQHPEYVKINYEAVNNLAQELQADPATVRESARSFRFPIKFDDLEAEVNFIALLHLLDFGSGCDLLLLYRNQRDAAETIKFGAIGMHLHGVALDASWMQSFSSLSVHNFFGIESREEQPVAGLPGVTMSRPGPLHPLASAIQQVMNETGSILEQRGSRSLGHFILSFLDRLAGQGHPAAASALVEELASMFPAFKDAGCVGSTNVVYLRKAQGLLADLHGRFAAEDARFRFPDAAEITADSGNILPAILRGKGVLEVSQELEATIDSAADLAPGPEERALRAAAIVAVDALASAAATGATGPSSCLTTPQQQPSTEAATAPAVTGTARAGSPMFTPHELSSYLLTLAQPDQLVMASKPKRHYTKGVVSY